MKINTLMFQGTGSDVGKSTLVAGLCRVAKRRGIRVAPFKPQNMSNNAAACLSGGEIGRAQALQAKASGLELHTDFNPVLLKPQSDMSAQVVVHGKVSTTTSAFDYMTSTRASLMDAVLESFNRLQNQFDLILVEGAGSASEVNLREHDIANMGFARAVGVPVCLVGDIDRGGVIASLVGTQAVIDPKDADLIRSFIVNRFRGDPTLFTSGVTAIEDATGWNCRGVVPWLPEALRLPQEDAVVLEFDQVAQASRVNEKSDADDNAGGTNPVFGKIQIAVLMLSRISNFDDLDPLRSEPQVDVHFIPPGTPIPLDTDVVIIPGTKSTIADLAFMRQQGWDHDVIALARSGARVLGLCGGYQILGETIADPEGIEDGATQAEGLGLLTVKTEMNSEKTVQQIHGVCMQSGQEITGYEIHIGSTWGDDTQRPMFKINGKLDGAISANGLIMGTYIHGVFTSDSFRRWWLDSVQPGASSNTRYFDQLESDIDELANALEESLDVDALLTDAVRLTL